MNGHAEPVVILSCSSIKAELSYLIDKENLTVSVYYLDSANHMNPEKMKYKKIYYSKG
jgi:gluconate kinase